MKESPIDPSVVLVRGELLRSLSEIERAVRQARTAEDLSSILGILRTLPDVVAVRPDLHQTSELLRAASARCARLVRSGTNR